MSVVCAYAAGVVINFLLTPLAATAAFTPAFGELGTAMNVNPLPLFYAFNFGLDQYIFPYEAVYFLYIFITERVLLRHIVTALAIRMLIVGIFVVVLAATLLERYRPDVAHSEMEGALCWFSGSPFHCRRPAVLPRIDFRGNIFVYALQ